MRLHRLVESALLHVAAYAPLSADKPALQRYMCEGMALVIPRLGVSVARYLQVRRFGASGRRLPWGLIVPRRSSSCPTSAKF